MFGTPFAKGGDLENRASFVALFGAGRAFKDRLFTIPQAGHGFVALFGAGRAFKGSKARASRAISAQQRTPLALWLKPRAQLVAGFNFAICSISSSSVAQPMKYRQTIS
jgi:hypothetical protein